MKAKPHSLTLTLTLVLVAGYLVSAYPFMQLRIPPTGFGVPLGELLLAFVLLTLNLPLVLARLGTVISLAPLLLLWAFGFTRLIIDTIREGQWALRDGTQLIETLYLIVGFALVATPLQVMRLSRWIVGILVAACSYGLLYGWSNELISISPTLPGGSDQAIPILGTFATTGTMLLLGAFYCMVQPARRTIDRIRYPMIAALLVCFAVLVIQMRTTYVQLAAMTTLLVIVRPAALGILALAVPVLAFLLLVIVAFDIRVSGRLSSEISFSFLWDHVQAIFGKAETETTHDGIADAASGVSLRLRWWLRLYGELTSDAATLLTGLGFGVPLTDFRDTLNIPTREPHNSIISVVSRLGLVGGGCWIWCQILLFKVGLQSYRKCIHAGRHSDARLLLVIIAFGVLTLAASLGEDIMEKPYNAIPYYFLWGAALRIAYNLREPSAGRVMGRPDPFPIGGTS